jgi:hypothetical protein
MKRTKTMIFGDLQTKEEKNNLEEKYTNELPFSKVSKSGKDDIVKNCIHSRPQQ